MNQQSIHAITGAFGYTGSALAQQLISRSIPVRTLTNSPDRSSTLRDQIDIHRLNFDDPRALSKSLEGVSVLYNTYWVRFNHKLFTFEQAVQNTKTLFQSAKQAGVQRIVHVSILNADQAHDLGYYKGKHELEIALKELDLPHTILRPGVLFGRGDILINNIAWTLRNIPILGTFGKGDYKLRPMHVDDMASLMLSSSFETKTSTIDAIGPESYTYRELVELIATTLNLDKPIISTPPLIAYMISKIMNPILKDTIITREEIDGLMRGLLDSDAPSTGSTKLSQYIEHHQFTLGLRYASELKRRTDRISRYTAP